MSLRSEGRGHRKPAAWVRPAVVVVLACALALGGGLVLQRALMGAGALPSASQARMPADDPSSESSFPPSADRPSVPLARPKPTNRGKAAAPSNEERARTLLWQQARAVVDGDETAYVDTIDPRNTALREDAARTYHNLRRMDAGNFTIGDVLTDAGALTPDRRRSLGSDAWVAEVTMNFTVAGAGGQPWRTTLRPAFVERDGQLYMASLREGTSSTDPKPLWEQAEVSTVQGEHSLVIGTGSTERLDDYARILDRAVPRIGSVWNQPWAERIVVIVPETGTQMEEAIGAQPGSQSQVAAVTTSVGRTNVDRASHIVVNPKTFGPIGEISRLVILTHEGVHVATHATMSNVPVWLSEGFADYVGFKNSGVLPGSVAERFLTSVREGIADRELPDADLFDPSSAELDEAYEKAWLACRYIAEEWDEDRLVKFYTRMNDAVTDSSEAEVYREVLGVSQRDFAVDWWDYVEHQAQES